MEQKRGVIVVLDSAWQHNCRHDFFRDLARDGYVLYPITQFDLLSIADKKIGTGILLPSIRRLNPICFFANVGLIAKTGIPYGIAALWLVRNIRERSYFDQVPIYAYSNNLVGDSIKLKFQKYGVEDFIVFRS